MRVVVVVVSNEDVDLKCNIKHHNKIHGPALKRTCM